MSENIEELEYELEDAAIEGYVRSGEEAGGIVEEEEDQFSLIGSSDDAEKQRMYMEYLNLIKDINSQNKMVADIKVQLAKLCGKECKTSCEIRNIRRLHNCLEQENLKLQCLINKAIELQNFGSKRHYKPIPIETSFDEDNLLYAGAIPQAVWKSSESTSDPCGAATSTSDPCTFSGSEGDDQEAVVCQILNFLKKMNICPEDKKMVKQIAATMLKGKKSKQKKSPCPRDPCSKRPSIDLISPNLPGRRDSVDVLQRKVNCVQAIMRKIKEQIECKERQCMQGDSKEEMDPMLAKTKKRLSSILGEIPRLQREIIRKEREMECGAPADGCLPQLKLKLNSLQCAVRKLKDELCAKQQKGRPSGKPCQSGSLEKLRDKICRLQGVMKTLKDELAERECDDGDDDNDNPCWDDQDEPEDMMQPPCEDERDPLTVCGSNRNSKSEQMRKLKENYLHLLSEYAKKDGKLRELEQKLKGVCGGCGGSKGGDIGGDSSAAELDLLRCRVNELREEQDEFKCIMKEQAQQLEDYRHKYLAAQQKVEEQTAALEKLNMNNKRIEKQINNEVKEIRAKFQEKLTELLQYPKLLENEQCKLAQVSKEKDDLQAKLGIICKELRNLKAQQEGNKTEDCRPQLAQCTLELEQAKASVGELQKQRDLLCEELQKVKDDLDTLRCESAKIIARTKERADQMKQYQQDQIDRLEKELAQCRATACLSVNDREAVIREMQGQLNTLSFSFDAAQKQIKTLRNHIAYVSNEKCFPIKC